MANEEQEELDIIKKYLPEQCNDEQLNMEVDKCLSEKIFDKRELSKAINEAKEKFGSYAPAKNIALTVKNKLLSK